MPIVAPPAEVYAAARAHFPSLASGEVFLDNGGGSQVPRVVADAIHHYLLHDYVQLGADSATSRRATAVVAGAHRLLKTFMNVPDGREGPVGGRTGGEVILGASTSELCARLAHAYADAGKPGDEFVVCQTGHESNIGPWVRLGRRGFVVKEWKVDPATGAAPLESLRGLLTPRTRLVAFPQVSNVLGEVIDLAPIVSMVHDAGARIMVDGVAYAPHRAIDVATWNVDWYVYSTYKVFGPHMAALYGRREALAELVGPNHEFIAKDDLPRKFELGGVNHEGAAGILALDHFLRDLAGLPRLRDLADPAAAFDRAVVGKAFDLVERLEVPLQARLVEYLKGKRGVRLIGPPVGDRSRICIISFRHERTPSRQIALAANERGLGIRSGHFYAHRLCKAMGLEPDDAARGGVVRVSFAHYNTPEEVDRLIEFFDEAL
ncbi:MAG: aminotransferase class V-fold PLP-dependent enzyme [Phycisphaerae bacterium]|nr:aminotransferase class V-fold PLP-dependent enzyme [Phycisphaerae bacterium]